MTFTVSVSDNGSPVLSDAKVYELKVLDVPHAADINNLTLMSDIEVFPNPATDYIRIIVLSITDNTLIRVINYLGVCVFEQKMLTNQIRINTTSFPIGIYCILLITDGMISESRNVVII